MAADLLFAIAVLLISAKVLGEIAERLGIASLVGELFAGIIVGPLLGIVATGPFLTDFIHISIIILLFMVGLEVKYDDVKGHAYTASALAAFGGLLSAALGFLVGMYFFNNVLIALAIGAVLISSSDATLMLFLMKTGEFNTKAGKLLIATTIADDVVGIVFLSIFSSFVASSTILFGSVYQVLLVSIGFYFAMMTVGIKITRFSLNVLSNFVEHTALFTVPLAGAFGLAFLTQQIGISVAAGAFLAGMAVANSHYAEHVISPKVKEAANGFFLPLFYATVGTFLLLNDLNLLLIAMLVAAAMLGKLIGAGFMSRFFGVDKEHSRLLGILMVPRGNENIAIVQVVFAMGIISFALYTSLIFAIVLTILITPILLRLFYKK